MKMLLNSVRRRLCFALQQIKGNSLQNLLNIVNFVPWLLGFSVEDEKLKAPFWILHFLFGSYVYLVGNIDYELNLSNRTKSEKIKHYVNMGILVIITNISLWWTRYRPLLRQVVILMKDNDSRVSKCPRIQKRKINWMKKLKFIVLIFLSMNYINSTLVYTPARLTIDNSLAMSQCVGLGPLTESPNYEICRFIIFISEVTLQGTSFTYQAFLMFFMAHTGIMYQIMAEELQELEHLRTWEHNGNINDYITWKLIAIIERHIQLLKLVQKLRDLYNVPIGIDFGANAFNVALIYCLSYQEVLEFIPVFAYSFGSFSLYCIVGQKLINSSKNYERALYCCGWESFSLKQKKLIYIMSIQAQKQVDILAGNTIPVNINTFGSAMHGLYKFVTVMKSYK